MAIQIYTHKLTGEKLYAVRIGDGGVVFTDDSEFERFYTNYQIARLLTAA